MDSSKKLMMGLGFGYAGAYVIALVIALAKWGVSGSFFDVLPGILLVLVVVSLPGFIGMAGKKIPFYFSFIVTVAVTFLVLLMITQAEDSLGAVCVLVVFLGPVLVISLIASVIAGIYLLIVFLVSKARNKKENAEGKNEKI